MRRLAVLAVLLALPALASAAQEPGAPDAAGEIFHRLEAIDLAGRPSLLLLCAAIAVATLVSEDLTCIAAGLLVARGRLPFAAAAAACWTGIFVGDLLLILAGRLLGEGAVRRRPFSRWIRPAALAASERWFLEKGTRAVFLSRFVPGSRLPLFVGAGILRAPVLPIAGALAIAGLLWTPLLVGLSAWTGGVILQRYARYERLALPVIAVALLASWVALRLVVPLFSWRGRRLLLSRWRRLTRWEFWPRWLFQAPVVAHVVRLGWKHGGIGTFAAANPGIPGGGFVEESKSAILDALGDAPVARYVRLAPAGDADARARQASEALQAAAISFPLVLKPDIGERGTGVAVAHDPLELAERLAGASGDWILQEYVPGEEFGVFYARRPGEERGAILSITAKRFPRVVGDGRRTLEELILADDRAVCMAPLHLEANAARLASVPADGEAIQLVEIGNHCRGTVFLDGREHETEALRDELDRIARRFPGFHFGRFDVRAPSVDAFREGRGLRILELNGVTSEATHIYHPGASLFAGWSTLFAQWRLAFEIGAANVARGAPRASVAELVALLRSRRRRFATIAHLERKDAP